MKKTVLKLGVIALALVMLLSCFAACGGGENDDPAVDDSMKVHTMNGTSFKYPKNFMVAIDTDEMFTAMNITTQDAVSVVSASVEISDEEVEHIETQIAEGTLFTENLPDGSSLEELYAAQFGVDVDNVTVSILNNTTIKLTFEREDLLSDKVSYCTAYYQTVLDAENNICYNNVITVMESSPSYELGSKVMGLK